MARLVFVYFRVFFFKLIFLPLLVTCAHSPGRAVGDGLARPAYWGGLEKSIH
jgi:hypothetical protein